jgi:hypothetical protein
MSQRYGSTRIMRGLSHFVLGKGLSALANLLAMLLVIRGLSIESFAVYSILIALVDTLTIISGFGIVNALLRYVPELYAKHYQSSLRSFVEAAVSLRIMLLLIIALLTYLFSESLAPLIGVGHAVSAMQVFLLVVVFRATEFFLSQVLESTLHQGFAQMGFAFAALFRLIGMSYLINQDSIQLEDVIWLEAIADALGVAMMLYGVAKVMTQIEMEEKNSLDDGAWPRRHFKQVAKFAVEGYVQHLALMPYGGNTNRLVGGSILNAGAMATYGFALSMYEYIKRYLPTYLLIGFIRPIVIARYSEHRDFTVAANLCNQVLQINILLIAWMFVILVVGGADMLAMISAGKYGADALALFAVLFLILLLDTKRQQLDLLVQTVERNNFLIPSNALMSSSILLALILLPYTEGALAFPIANAIGLIAANLWVQHQMKSEGFEFKHNWIASIRVLFICTISIALGLLVKNFGVPWYLATFISVLTFTAMSYIICRNMLRSFALDMTGKKTQLPELKQATHFTKPKIAFGILSSKDSEQAIDELAAAVYPHSIYVHHDFTKTPNFYPKAKNVNILKDPVVTAWGDWSLVEATYHLMQAAVVDKEMTHFQLLSEACLPVRPISEFEEFLCKERPDVMMDIYPLENKDALFSHGWRYFQNSKFSMRLLKRCSIWIWGEGENYRLVKSVNLNLAGAENHFVSNIKRRIGKCVLTVYAKSFNSVLLENGLKQAAIGGQWFAANRSVIEWLLLARHHTVTFTRHYRHCPIPDESYLHTLLLSAQQSGASLRLYPSNHALYWDAAGTGPDLMQFQDFTKVKASGKFFARKFSLSADDELRQCVLSHIK